MTFPLEKEWLDLLACPRCKGELKLIEKPQGLACERCDLFYEIRQDIPIMLIEEAKRYSEIGGHESSS